MHFLLRNIFPREPHGPKQQKYPTEMLWKGAGVGNLPPHSPHSPHGLQAATAP